MWILFIAIVIGCLVFSSIHDHNKDVKTNVTDHGGMLVKYKVLIDYLTSSKATIRKVTKNTVVITGGSSVWLLNYIDNNLYVELNGFMPIYGKINKRWTFPSNCPQESMIQAIENYLTWQLNKFTEMTAKYNEHNEII